MIRRRSRTAPLAACFCLFAACDPARMVTETDLFPELRRRSLEDCCRCLAESHVPTQAASCAPDEYGTGEEAGDAEGVKTVTCLCDVDVESCTEALWAGDTITLLGTCTQSNGPCEGACDGVLAYP